MSADSAEGGRPPSGKALPPPIYHLAGVAAKREGDHSHDTWHVRVVHESIAGHSLPMIVKAIPSQVTMAVELACGLAARELRLNVPQPALVLADRSDLPDLETKMPGGDQVVLIGSHYQRPDALFAEAVQESAAAEELIWQNVCSGPVARQGAVWDELIANPDRHCENVLFDGTTWWLIDHDQALAPAAQFTQEPQGEHVRRQAIEYNAEVNQLATELTRRFAGQHQSILEQARRIDSGAKRLHALTTYAATWTHPVLTVHHVLQLVSVVLGLIHLRLPALKEKIGRRVGIPSPGDSLFR